MGISIYYQNVRGLRTKTNTFSVNSLSCSFDIVCLTETFLNSSVYNSEIFPPTFDVIRRDRSSTACLKKDGGGVLIAVRSSLNYIEKLEWNSDAEDVWISLIMDNNDKKQYYHVCCVYLPPEDHVSMSNFLNKLADIVDSAPNDNFLIVGDFNLPHLQWDTNLSHNGLKPLNTYNSSSSNFVDCISYCNIYQFNHIRNSNNRILDFVISNFENIEVIPSQSPLSKVDVHHPPIEIYVRHDNSIKITSCPRKLFLYKSANYNIINEKLNEINWDLHFENLDIDSMLQEFYTVLYNLINNYVPVKKYIHSSYPEWYTASLIKLIKEKSKAHAKYKQYKAQKYYNEFSSLRKLVKSEIKKCYDIYTNNVENLIPQNSKKFWSYVSSKKSTNGIPNTMCYETEIANNGNDICNLFSKYFKSVFVDKDGSNNNFIQSSPNCNELIGTNISFNEYEVLDTLLQLDVNKGAGPDNIPSIFIKNCSYSLCYPLMLIFNKSLNEGYFPTVWKKAYVVPVFKGGTHKNQITNYRPISKLNIFEKIFEKLVYRILFSMVKSHIIPQQHGFYPGRSVESNLLTYNEYILKCMDERSRVDSVYTDFSKAFDTIDHFLLLKKLSDFGVCGSLLDWFRSYLTGRSQRVTINGFQSNDTFIPSGVPQGSHLGPLLFNIFINDVYKCFKFCNFLLYADDLKMYHSVNNTMDCLAIQDDINRFYQYTKDNKLFLNIQKCCQITFSRNRENFDFAYTLSGELIVPVTQVKDLGLILDQKLLFDLHVDYITKKSYKMLGFLIRTSGNFKNPNTFKLLYFSLVRSQLEFATVCWSPQYTVYLKRIERIQEKFVKFMNFKFPNYDLNLISLEKRRIIIDLTFLYKLSNNKINCAELINSIGFRVPTYTTRTSDLFYIGFNRTNAAFNSAMNRLPYLYNKYSIFDKSIDIFNCSITTFKKQITHIINSFY